jgi:hypothetical protein
MTDTIVFIADLRFALFLDHVCQQRRLAFANAARPLKDHARSFLWGATCINDGPERHNARKAFGPVIPVHSKMVSF